MPVVKMSIKDRQNEVSKTRNLSCELSVGVKEHSFSSIAALVEMLVNHVE